MGIYSFWSGDTTYFTKSRSLKKAKSIGKENMQHYLETCKYLEEKPEVGKEHFIPEQIETVTPEWFKYIIKVDPDILILDDELMCKGVI